MSQKTSLKLTKAQFGLVIVIVNAGIQLFNSFLPTLGLTPALAAPIEVFLIAIGNGVVVYLAAEQKAAPTT